MSHDRKAAEDRVFRLDQIVNEHGQQKRQYSEADPCPHGGHTTQRAWSFPAPPTANSRIGVVNHVDAQKGVMGVDVGCGVGLEINHRANELDQLPGNRPGFCKRPMRFAQVGPGGIECALSSRHLPNLNGQD